MLSVADALSLVLAAAEPVLPAETVALAAASGRTLAAPLMALRTQPPFPASAMDGYALRAADATVPGATLTVIGTAAAGHAFGGRIGPGEAVRIFTGAPVPEGASQVVIQEDVIASGARILLKDGLDAGLNIRPAGQDFRAGDTLGPRRLRPADLALLAAMNVARVPVARRPVVALIATGDELVMPGESPRADQIIASNAFALAAMAEAEGA
jgi:molybdopterin molybdotransferase